MKMENVKSERGKISLLVLPFSTMELNSAPVLRHLRGYECRSSEEVCTYQVQRATFEAADIPKMPREYQSVLNHNPRALLPTMDWYELSFGCATVSHPRHVLDFWYGERSDMCPDCKTASAEQYNWITLHDNIIPWDMTGALSAEVYMMLDYEMGSKLVGVYEDRWEEKRTRVDLPFFPQRQ